MNKRQALSEVKTYLAVNGDEYRYDIVHHANSIEVKKIKTRSFADACIDWYKKNCHLIFDVKKACFEKIGDYTFCVLTHKNKTRFGVAKRYKDDRNDPVIGYVAAFARATDQDLELMIGLK